MRSITVISTGVLLLSLMIFGRASAQTAKAELASSRGEKVGSATLAEGPQGEVVAAHVTLGAGAHSLFHPDGTALVIHANPDDEVTDPTGNAGGRIACGVITR